MKKLIEIDPNKVLYSAQSSLMQKINFERSKKVNDMIIEHVPKWKIYLMKKSTFFSRLFKIFAVIEPQMTLESDVVREKLILYKSSNKNPTKIAEVIFYIQDKRKLDVY